MNSFDDFDSENLLEENFIDCGVKDLSTLHFKKNISTLNLHYNNISVIKGLQDLNQLRHLDLSSNLITKISGLDRLASLRTLNLSCNRLKKLEGLSSLRQLVRLNVSYNEICDLNGLGELGQYQDHPLTVIEANHNQVRLVTHVINNCQKLLNLRQLNFANNPVSTTPDYRKKVFNGLSQIRILDGKDKSGKDIEINILSDIPGLEHFMEYLSSSTEFYSEDTDRTINKNIRSINDNALLTSSKEHKVYPQELPHKETKIESELKGRLQDLEEKLTKFVTEKSNTISSVPNKVSDLSIKNRESRSQASKDGDIKEKKDESIIKMAKLMKDLDEERRRRLDVENKLQTVVTRYKELQLSLTNDRRSKEEAVKATEKLSSAFSREKSLKEELEHKLIEMETVWNQRHREVIDSKKMLEFSYEDIRTKLEMREKELRNKSEELVEIKRSLEEVNLKQQVSESSLTSVRKHCTNLEEQVDNLQATLSRREKEYQMNLANRFSIDSKELQEYIQVQVKMVKEQDERELNATKEKLNDSNHQYKMLEDEFRLALHMEADRYENLQKSYRQIAMDSNSLKTKVEILSKKDTESRVLIEELTAVAKDQKSKLIELSKNKQEKNKDNKERILTLEAHLEEARKQMIQFELTKQQENKKLQAKQSAQESVIEGLKTERKLWSEELAQQGYLLTQDRAKLECKIESQICDISRVKMELEKEVETSRNKSKLIEDQTATIIRLKEGLLEKDLEAKSFSEKLLEDHKELENRVKFLSQENNHYAEDVAKLTKRKEELKDVIGDLEDKLEESMASREIVNQKWKEKSELIAKLESQVVQMKDYWEKKTEELVEERSDAVDRYQALKSEFDSLEFNYKSQLEIAYKNTDFIKQDADQRVSEVENEMRKLLIETNEEKKKLKGRLRILNRAIEEMDNDKKN